ncbi:MAG: helix-turn-helix transcriptional regulator [Chloroflexi bacterium]|nr:helix-turn-helix transcriptional regulator [Chloroflexota bacterium]
MDPGSRVVSSPTSVSAESSVSLEGDLLATKVTVPRVRAGLVARPGLAGRLADATTYDLCLVCSPPGFGKTTALASWAAGSERRVGWLALDEDDNDPVRFWRYMLAALRQVRPDIGQQASTLLTRPGDVYVDAVVTALINELAMRDDDLTLVLDDYHVVDSPRIHNGVAFLIDHLPTGLRLVIAGRSDPPLPFGDLRARGRLAEVRAADLRFSAEETASFLRDLCGLRLPDDAVAALTERTEGWVAGLQLAALSLRHQPDPAAFVAAFAGSHRFVLDYLSEEVLARQPEEMRQFLLTTSILERLSGPLCDALTGRTDGQQLLEQAERANLFVAPLDDRRRWYRYHHLFADLLRVRLGQECPEQLAGLHRRAADWYRGNGLVSDAVHHVLAAGDDGDAIRLIEASAEELIWWRSEGATLERWLAMLPPGTLSQRPRLALARGLRALVSARMDEAAACVAAAERAPASTLVEPFTATVGRQQSELVNVVATIAFIRAVLASRVGDAEQAEMNARRALDHLTEDDRQLGLVVQALPAEAAWIAGRLADAEHLASAAIVELRIDDRPEMSTRLLFVQGRIQQAGGRLRDAEQTFRRALERMSPSAGEPPPAASLQHIGLADVLRQRGDLEGALRHAAIGLDLSRRIVSTEPVSAGLATLAWAQYASGDRASARTTADEAARVVPSAQVVSLFNPGPAERARLLLALGETDEIDRWVAERGLRETDPPSYPHEREQLVLARLRLAHGEAERALPLLSRLHAAAVTQGRTGSTIEVRALQALAFDVAARPDCALDALHDALTLAAPEAYVAAFVDEGAPMADLLRRFVASSQRGYRPSVTEEVVGYATGLLALASRSRNGHDGADSVARIASAMVLIEPLTEREAEVLLLLAEGRSNREIAARLVVTLDTVKKHLTHIFGKLDAASRTQAVARARELRLLS